jgi:hypothetical protein
VKPLKYVAEKATGTAIGKLTLAALELLGKLTGWW